MPKIETVYCAKCGAANQGYLRADEAVMVLQINGKYENSNIVGCQGCQKYPTGVDDVWTVDNEAVFRPLKRKYDRIHRKANRDKQRKRPYKPRPKTQTLGKNLTENQK